MFDTKNLLRILSVILSIGFSISGITGFNEISKNFILSNLMLSLHSIFMFFFSLYFEFSEKLDNNGKDDYFVRGILYTYSSILILGISKVSLGIGIYGIIIGVCNLINYYINKDTIELSESRV